MDEPSIREMAEYLSEAGKEELVDKVSNRPVTVIVYHNGDQLNFFRVVDRESTSPLSGSLRY
jgi:AN1-type zinc finger and ubiquitin domain-containing protein 1